MKKWTKILLILAVVCLTIGIGFTISGVMMGATAQEFDSMFDRDDVVTVMRTMGVEFDDEDEEEEEDLDEDAEEVSFRSDDGEREYEIAAEEISDVEIRLSVDEVTMRETGGDRILVRVSGANADAVKVLSSGNTLKIRQKNKKIQIGKGIEVVVEYPKDKNFESFTIRVGAGEAEIDGDLRADKIRMEIGAGECSADGRITCKEGRWSVGAGALSIGHLEGAKQIFQCGVGEINARMEGSERDYNYEIQCGIGEIHIGREEYSGLGKKMTRDNGAENQISADCGLGSIEISFS